MRFRPEEVLFAPTEKCNLDCPHCNSTKTEKTLPAVSARKFLAGCRAAGVRRVGFTGGEPFLAADFLCELSKSAVKEGLLFGRIMTNGVWYRSRNDLVRSLENLRTAGYDGSICVSLDVFHGQNLEKAARFIETAISVWRRPDMVSIAYTGLGRDAATKKILRSISRLLKVRLTGLATGHTRIENNSMLIRIFRIALSPVGKASFFKDPWDGAWFKEDYCRGPGNVFFVMPDGSVKPCCGYASGNKALTIGNIRRDRVSDILKKADENRFVSTVFSSGLSGIRKRMAALGERFPGKTTSHCYFCHYLLNEVPGDVLRKCLN